MSLKPKNVDFMETWSGLQETMTCVITFKNITKSTWNDRFSDVYSLCVAHPEPYADKLYMETHKFIGDHVSELLSKVTSGGDQFLLDNYFKAWKDFSKGVQYLHQLFQYLNNQHIRKQRMSDAELNFGSLSSDTSENMKEIGELGLDIWKSMMIDPLQDDLRRLLLEGIRYDRIGGTAKGASTSMFCSDMTIKGVINSFVEVEQYKKKMNLNLYESCFEYHFLKDTGAYYNEEASNILKDGNISQYMESVLARIDGERIRGCKFIYPSSIPKVIAECEKQMIGNHLEILNSECLKMVMSENLKDLRNIYKLLKPIPNAQAVLLEEIQNHIKSQGLRAIDGLKQETIAQDFVENVLSVHNKYLNLIKDVFNGDQSYVGALDKASTAIINARPPKQSAKAPEYLARYCDNLLRKTVRGMTETEIDEKLTQSIIVFKYLDDKDVFQKFYARSLGKRLIHQQAQSMYLEETMINRLKAVCGFEFTNKFHRMYSDINVADVQNAEFSQYLKDEKIELSVSHYVRVLQQGAWPLGNNTLSPLNVPYELEKAVQMYEKFYAKSFSGRKLTWLHHLSTNDVKLGYLSKIYIITMSTFQLAIMLMFESLDSIPYKELLEATKISEEHFPKFIQTLLDAKLLDCSTQELNPESQLILNLRYSNKRTKFRIPGNVQKDVVQEVEQTHHAVDEDRKMYLQAVIVRTMKSRKVLKHNMLVQEVLSQSKNRFSPSVAMIKKCIESLIDKAYIERCPKANDEYSYIA